MFSNLFSIMLRLLSLIILGLLSNGHPIPDTPKWYKHCKAIPDSSHHLSHKFSEPKSLTIISELFEKVEKSALISLKRAENVKRKFVEFEHIFDDFEGLRLKSDFKWLPTIPPTSEEFFRDITKERALLRAHEYIEKFAVALEQIVIDQNDNNINDVYIEAIDGIQFKNIDDDNYNVLCEIRIAMSVVFGSVDEHFITMTERSIMPEEDRLVPELSKRLLRDYLIIRQYVKTTHFIKKMFEYIRQNS